MVRALTFVIARDAPVGVVIANYSQKLSRMFLWNTDTDEFEAGQFVKAFVEIEDVSPNGKYVAYFAQHFGGNEYCYLAVAHPPYFTALGIFPTIPVLHRHANFLSNELLDLYSVAPTGYPSKPYRPDTRMEPNSPIQIQRGVLQEVTMAISGTDSRGREILAENGQLVAIDPNTSKRTVLKTFEREPFQEVPPPDWATKW